MSDAVLGASDKTENEKDMVNSFMEYSLLLGRWTLPQGPGGSPSSAWRFPLPPARIGQGSLVCGEDHGVGILHPALPHSSHDLDQVTSLAGVIPQLRSTLPFHSLPSCP